VAVNASPAVGYPVPVPDYCTIHVFKAMATGRCDIMSPVYVTWYVHKTVVDSVHHHELRVLFAELEGR